MILAVGCETPEGYPYHAGSGALAGGAIGAGSGAIIGSATGRACEGALIGGALGALTGGLIGSAMDDQQREILAHQYPQTYQRVEQGQALGVADIKALARAGVSDEVIISQIRNSRAVYRLSTADILDLKDAGVSERVIDYMINTPGMFPPPRLRRRRIITEPEPFVCVIPSPSPIPKRRRHRRRPLPRRGEARLARQMCTAWVSGRK